MDLTVNYTRPYVYDTPTVTTVVNSDSDEPNQRESERQTMTNSDEQRYANGKGKDEL